VSAWTPIDPQERELKSIRRMLLFATTLIVISWVLLVGSFVMRAFE